MSQALPKRLDSIQCLRGIAALLVLFFHLAAFQREMAVGNAADIALTSGIWDRGWAGVDLFFVISGFIMVYVTRETGRSFGDVRKFLTSRITRIYPLWWVCAGIMMVYFWVTYGIPAAPDRIAGPNEAATYAVKSMLLIPQDAPPILGLGWTLIHEMFFYLIFALILFLPKKYLLPALIAWAVLTVAGSFLIWPAAFGRNILELLASPFSLEFIAGGIAGWLVSRGRFAAPQLCFYGGIVLAVIGFIAFSQNGESSYTVSRVAIFTLPFVLLVYGAVGREIVAEKRYPLWLSRLGDWSYSLYLTHYIVLVTLRRIYRMAAPENLKVGAEGALDNVVFAVLALAISIVTSAIFYTIIERPAVNFFKQRRA